MDRPRHWLARRLAVASAPQNLRGRFRPAPVHPKSWGAAYEETGAYPESGPRTRHLPECPDERESKDEAWVSSSGVQPDRSREHLARCCRSAWSATDGNRPSARYGPGCPRKDRPEALGRVGEAPGLVSCHVVERQADHDEPEHWWVRSVGFWPGRDFAREWGSDRQRGPNLPDREFRNFLRLPRRIHRARRASRNRTNWHSPCYSHSNRQKPRRHHRLLPEHNSWSQEHSRSCTAHSPWYKGHNSWCRVRSRWSKRERNWRSNRLLKDRGRTIRSACCRPGQRWRYKSKE